MKKLKHLRLFENFNTTPVIKDIKTFMKAIRSNSLQSGMTGQTTYGYDLIYGFNGETFIPSYSIEDAFDTYTKGFSRYDKYIPEDSFLRSPKLFDDENDRISDLDIKELNFNDVTDIVDFFESNPNKVIYIALENPYYEADIPDDEDYTEEDLDKEYLVIELNKVIFNKYDFEEIVSSGEFDIYSCKNSDECVDYVKEKAKTNNQYYTDLTFRLRSLFR